MTTLLNTTLLRSTLADNIIIEVLNEEIVNPEVSGVIKETIIGIVEDNLDYLNKLSLDNCRDVSIRITESLIDKGIILDYEDAEESTFLFQDIVTEQLCKMLGIDYE